MLDHNFMPDEFELTHRNLTLVFVANVMYLPIVNNLNYKPWSIIRAIEEQYQYTISYNKACRAKSKAIEMRFGTYEASYDNLPCLLQTIA